MWVEGSGYGVERFGIWNTGDIMFGRPSRKACKEVSMLDGLGIVKSVAYSFRHFLEVWRSRGG